MTPLTEPLTRLIAFHLPQFHPIPENDAWWGPGFTEWTNVTRARPRFPGHYQPHLPADLGFYDLRLPEARGAQAELARRYGVYGFCYYHYWFHGRRLLERPVNDILTTGEPDFPFCLCWANETWSRNWDGQNRSVLVEQRYSPEDDEAHIRSLLPAFADPRYIRIDGKPLFLVYRSTLLPEPTRTIDRWRQVVSQSGVGEVFFARVESTFFLGEVFHPPGGFDAVVEFAPRVMDLNPVRNMAGLRNAVRFLRSRVSNKIGTAVKWWVDRLEAFQCRLSPYSAVVRDNRLFSYSDLVDAMLARPHSSGRRFSGVCPGWDNSARRKENAYILTGSTPERYEHWLRAVVRRNRAAGRGEDPIFVNAWNEWAEGCHLEPCQKWGRAYLEATARALAVCRSAPATALQRT
jgi:hypothetical protein